MNKSELVEILAERAKITRKRAETVVNLIFDSMTAALVRGDRIDQAFVGRLRARYHHQAGGILIEAMDNPGTRQIGQLGGVMQQAVLQRAIPIAGRRVHDESCRLVDNQQIIIFKYDLQRNILRDAGDLRFDDGREPQTIAQADLVARSALFVVHPDPALARPGLQPTA